MQKINKAKILILVVVITALLSCFAVGVVLAKYSSQFNGAFNGATATFDVTTSVSAEQTLNFELSPQTPSAEYAFSVTNNSQVPVVYDVVVTLPTALPDGVISLSIGQSQVSVENSTYTFSQVGSFAVQGQKNTHVLTITALDFSVLSLDEITVKVVASQQRN